MPGLISLLVFFAVLCLILWLVFGYLLPMLPEPVRRIATVIIVVIVIISLLYFLLGYLPASNWTGLRHG
jgi:hypothetical protein